SDYRVGDVVKCVMWENVVSVLLPITPAPEHTPIKGDVDENGVVNIMDVILLNRHLMVGAEISEQGMQNAITYTANDGVTVHSDNAQRLPDATDSLNILKYIVGLVTDLSVL
ncbi:MAG: hypothetical protein K2I93_04420, partial [Oscillospiraceae bacterium]|nr:hypothetical protein [Oscillospiraceae bacterium]